MKKETLIAILVAVIVLVLSNVYVFYGLLQPKDKLYFLGRRVINSQDVYTYVSFIEQSRQGRFLFENLYSSDPQKQNLVRPSYVLLGKIAMVLNISSIAMYHMGRVIFSILFFFVLYKFLSFFFKNDLCKLISFSLILTSSGWGFILGNFYQNASDLWIPESITFLSLGEAPHFILSQSLMIASFLFLLKGWKTGKKVYFIFTALSLMLLGFEHPFNLIVCFAAVFMTTVYFYFKKDSVNRGILLWGSGVALLSSGAGLLYQVYEVFSNPALRSWASQSFLVSPIPMQFILGYGFILIFALIGVEQFLKTRKPEQILILSWVAASCVLLYSPIFFQRRFSEGLHIPIGILAGIGIIYLAELISSFTVRSVQKMSYYGFIFSVLFIMMLGSIGNIYQDITALTGDSTSGYYYYILNSEKDAMLWLSSKTTFKDVILANWFYGNILPGIAGRKVYVGHKVQTPDFEGKVAQINKFLLDKKTTEAYDFLKKNNITYIFLGNNDTMLGYGFKPDEKPYLIKEYDQDSVAIYKVRKL